MNQDTDEWGLMQVMMMYLVYFHQKSVAGCKDAIWRLFELRPCGPLSGGELAYGKGRIREYQQISNRDFVEFKI